MRTVNFFWEKFSRVWSEIWLKYSQRQRTRLSRQLVTTKCSQILRHGKKIKKIFIFRKENLNKMFVIVFEKNFKVKELHCVVLEPFLSFCSNLCSCSKSLDSSDNTQAVSSKMELTESIPVFQNLLSCPSPVKLDFIIGLEKKFEFMAFHQSYFVSSNPVTLVIFILKIAFWLLYKF